MKTIITTSLIGAIALAMPATAEETKACASCASCSKAKAPAKQANPLLTQVSEKISAKPSTAADVVKQAIIQSKADAELVLQIVKVAVTAAPEQAEAIRKVAIALAPDVKKEVEIMIAAVLNGDEVAAADSVKAARDKKKNAGNEPEGREPGKNTVWLTNRGALQEGNTDTNDLPSKVQNTAISPNVNHNQGTAVRGGSTVVIRPPVVPPPTTPITPPVIP